MMKKITILSLFALFTLMGCIKNDIPYPIRKAVITAIEFRGQESVEIDAVNRVVTVVFPETADLKKVELIKFETTENTSVTPSVAELPIVLNLEKDLVFSLATYQKYEWTIKATLTVNRSADFEGQKRVVFDATAHTALVYVDSETYEKRSNIKVNSLVLGPQDAITSPDPTAITDWTTSHDFEVTAFGATTTWKVAVVEAFATYSPAKIRAYYSVLRGIVASTDEQKYGFEYKKEGEATYKQISGAAIEIEAEGGMTARIETDPASKYVYRVFLEERKGAEMTFTTDATPTVVPNFSFEDWTLVGKVYFPCTLEESKSEPYGGFWKSGNQGVSVAGKPSNVYPTDDAVKGKAACLETIGGVLFVKMAAGSFFTGDFKTNIGDPLSSPRFGRPYVGRPDKLVGKYKYLPKIIDIANTKDEAIKAYLGQMDRCVIWINLEDWGDATVRPAEQDRVVIARGELKEYGTVDKYKDFEIVLDYKIENRMPTHIVIVAAASEFGDFYTGGVGTKLFIDEFELIYK